jgi:hypothetical protein
MITQQKLTEAKISKGRSGAGYDVSSWTPVRKCSGPNCKAFEICAYEKSPTAKCGVENKFIQAMYKSLTPVIDNSDQYTVQQIGFMVLPLYLQLMRFYIIESGIEDMFVEDLRAGKFYEHPVYKSIRETIKAINDAVNKTDLRNIFKSAGLLDVQGIFKSVMSQGDAVHGDPDYYAEMSQADS